MENGALDGMKEECSDGIVEGASPAIDGIPLREGESVGVPTGDEVGSVGVATGDDVGSVALLLGMLDGNNEGE